LQKEKQRLAAQGRSHALYYGAHLAGAWWTGGLWKEMVVPPIVLELLEPLRRLIQALEQELKTLSQSLTDAAPKELPERGQTADSNSSWAHGSRALAVWRWSWL
jgi:hypothetical protein